MKPRLSGNIFLCLWISLLVACGGGEGNKGWIEITEPSSEDYFEVLDGNLDLVLAGNFIYLVSATFRYRVDKIVGSNLSK